MLRVEILGGKKVLNIPNYMSLIPLWFLPGENCFYHARLRGSICTVRHVWWRIGINILICLPKLEKSLSL